MYARDDVARAEDWQQPPAGARLDDAVQVLRMLADHTRLRMMWLLSGAEYDVTTLASAVGIARPAVSQHLAKLRLAGLVDVRRDGRRTMYHARGDQVRRLLLDAVPA